MRHAITVGFRFGLTSAVVTTLGLMVGLYSTTRSGLVVIGGILTIAIADAFSDALGIHISEESENVHTVSQVWIATISTFLAKFIFSSSFIIPVLIFSLNMAILINIIWGFCVLIFVSYKIAREQDNKPLKVIFEHLIIALTVIVITHLLGHWISASFS
jgi:VIT1/CCC1 family predicted Fe2+/Mn2+ transporter